MKTRARRDVIGNLEPERPGTIVVSEDLSHWSYTHFVWVVLWKGSLEWEKLRYRYRSSVLQTHQHRRYGQTPSRTWRCCWVPWSSLAPFSVGVFASGRVCCFLCLRRPPFQTWVKKEIEREAWIEWWKNGSDGWVEWSRGNWGGYVEWPSPSLTPDSETWPRRLTESNSASDVE